MKFVIAACVLYFVTVNVIYGTVITPIDFGTKTSSNNMTIVTRTDDGKGTREVTSQNTTHVSQYTGDETNNTDTLMRDQK